MDLIKKIDYTIKKLTSNERFQLGNWNHGIVSVIEIKEKYDIRRIWFEKQKGYKSKFYEKILSGISNVEDEHIILVSIEFEDMVPAFAFLTLDMEVLFYSGPLLDGDSVTG